MELFFEIKKTVKRFLPYFLVDWYHFLLSFFGAFLYRLPSYEKKMKVIGVTGTNGKSTVVRMISQIFEEAGFFVAYSSSVNFKIKEKETKNVLRVTMPGRFKLQKFLREAADANCQYVILEVTSEGIKQHRHRFIDFDVAVFTNLSPEHIESHGSFENYRDEKKKLFKATKKIHILNLDDRSIGHFMKFNAYKKYGFLIDSKFDKQDTNFQTIRAENCFISEQGIRFSIRGIEFKLKLLGKFNIHNALAAICVALSQGIDLAICKSALEKMGIMPGRMEIIISSPFKVLIDYAFTPNALEKVYQSLKNGFSPKKMICLLGACGGGRDKWKRPVLGQIASRYCDRIIVTNEDPYDEDPMEIIKQVVEGVDGNAEMVLDRREAIKRALDGAGKGDLVILTGKGSEPSICLAGGKKVPWNEKKIALEEFASLKKKIE